MNINNILETIRMIEEEKLDIRTITMGISLIDCIDSDGDRCREKIYNEIVSSAKDLVKVGREIENEFGGLLGRAPVMEVNKYSSELFIKRGGKIPAPIHSFKN